ncbi:FAD-binding domain-containing protein [Aspergillus heterothallicus]
MYILMNHGIFTLLLFVLISNAVADSELRLRDCRCLPSDRCWPSMRNWEAFNRTINGHLLRLRPIGSACHGAEFDQVKCDEVRANSGDALWRISQPGALIVNNWETKGENGTCFPDSLPETICEQGRVPHYAVMAESAQEVQAAVRFARRHNLRVVIRNTGHDGAGRSSGPGSLQINTSRFKQVQLVDNFIPRGGHQSLGSAVTAGAGMLGYELLEAARLRGVNVVAGVGSSVGVTGGFLLGGGTGLLSPLHGMGSDNALQFKVVTAEGDLVVANQVQNPDLFWALRGGGGGTFGVVVEATIRTFPDVPAVMFNLTANLAGNPANRTIWDMTREIAALLPDLKRLDNTTSAVLLTMMSEASASLAVRILFPNTTDVHSTRNNFTGFFQAIDQSGLPYTYDLTMHPQVSTCLPIPESLRVNYGRVEGSILVSEDLFFQQNGTNKILDLLSSLDYRQGDHIEYQMSAGGQVKANKGIIDSALLPAWRDSVALISFRRTLPPTSTVKTMENNQMPRLYGLQAPFLGSYLNAGDPAQPNFQSAFWGDNYRRLLQIKRKWDRDDLFIVNLGVGSEGWDVEGICRVRTS